MTSTIVSAADAGYFALLKGLILSIREKPDGAEISLSILDVGLDEQQRRWLKDQGAEIAIPEWDFAVPSSLNAPSHFRALLSRPFLPEYFPGHDTYLHIDADAWVQDWSAVDIYLASAAKGQLAITPQVDRSYNTIYKRPRPYRRTQNYRSFKWSYGVRIADRIARNPILNCGVFALPSEAPHWNLWAAAIRRALERRTFPPRGGWPDLYFKLIEQTAMNYVVFAEGVATTLLPATCNWFCAHAAPKFDSSSKMLVEPNAPYQPIGIIHLAGEGFQDQAFDLETLDRNTINTRLRYEDVRSLNF
ncbi:MAG: hypothetical protein CFH41_02478 [Alphaproteobacteria bacterium MarineAlpha11_Bin1]|nr:MAG: hypothetical protein CFH41_02478 [Alphaproteobacteria bacterium MarineAlpha11_Bin1]|tara:strand:+ start:426 stop:1337 length:912 start_codon:yes stop_codon:yes gene_type:complete